MSKPTKRLGRGLADQPPHIGDTKVYHKLGIRAQGDGLDGFLGDVILGVANRPGAMATALEPPSPSATDTALHQTIASGLIAAFGSGIPKLDVRRLALAVVNRSAHIPPTRKGLFEKLSTESLRDELWRN